MIETAQDIAKICVAALRSGNKVMFCGNGGSAADCQHLAAELVGKLNFSRPPLAGLALTTDTSAITAIGNDYGFEYIFSRQIEALGKAGDVLIAISTSGNSTNILKAVEIARLLDILTVGMTGESGGKMECDIMYKVPSTDTQKIQECHIKMGHMFCGLIEQGMFG